MHTKRTKKSRMRASKVTAGTGAKKKHRGTGHQGGAGYSNSGKRGSAKIIKVTKGDTHFLGKHGFKSLLKDQKVINLTELQNRVATLAEKGLVQKTNDSYEVDITKLGYDKLLSKGDISIKLNIKAKSATENAIERVKKAGGTVELEK